MSLDLYLYAMVPCPHCGKGIKNHDEVWHKNITHNVTPMWKEAGVYEALYESDGKMAKDVYLVVHEGIARMEIHADDFKKLNPKNGWGSYDSALKFLQAFQKAIEDYPDAIIKVSA